jgi:hypothetical protein
MGARPVRRAMKSLRSSGGGRSGGAIEVANQRNGVRDPPPRSADRRCECADRVGGQMAHPGEVGEMIEENVTVSRVFGQPGGGMTGLWQVSGRSELDSDEALGMDRFYIENWSFGLDLFILGRTVGAVLGRKGAQ